MKCKAITLDGMRVVGEFIRHADNYSSVIYAGGYESIFVDRKSIVFLQG